MTNTTEISKLKGLLEFARHKFDSTERASEIIDEKSSGLLNFCLAFAVAYFSLAFPNLPNGFGGFVIIGLLLLLSAIFFSFRASAPRDFQVIAANLRKNPEYLQKSYSEKQALLQLISNAEFAQEKNNALAKTKLRAFHRAKLMLILSVLILLLPLIMNYAPFVLASSSLLGGGSSSSSPSDLFSSLAGFRVGII